MKCANCGTEFVGNFCSKCGRRAYAHPDTKQGAKVVKRPAITKSNKIIMISVISIAVSILVIIGISAIVGTNKSSKRADQRTMLVYASREAVKKELKSPSGAKFPTADDESYKVIPLKDKNTYNVGGYVDAPNSFGATLRSKYIVKVEYLPSTDEYRILSTKIFE